MKLVKTLLRLVVGLSILILSLGMTMGIYEYQTTGARKMLILSGVGIILWIPTMYLVVKYLNEEDDE